MYAVQPRIGDESAHSKLQARSSEYSTEPNSAASGQRELCVRYSYLLRSKVKVPE